MNIIYIILTIQLTCMFVLEIIFLTATKIKNKGDASMFLYDIKSHIFSFLWPITILFFLIDLISELFYKIYKDVKNGK